MTFTEAEAQFLASQILGRLATVAPDGTVQNSPVGFRVDPATGTVDIGGHALGRTKKFRNVRAGGRVALVVDELASTRPWRVRGVEIRGPAEALVDADPPMTGMSREVIRIHPQRVISWWVEPGVDGMRARDVRARGKGP